MKKLTLVISLLAGFAAFAQQDPHYSLFMFNKQAINPAYVGSRGTVSASMDYRTQWTNLNNGNPETFNVGIHSPIGKGATVPNHAAGLFFYNDNIGVSKANGLAAQYAYRLRVSEGTMLSFGLEANVLFFNKGYNDINVPDSDDDALQGGNNAGTLPNFGAGLYLYNDRYYAGISAPKLLKQANISDDADNFNTEQHYYAMAGYVFPVTEDIKLRANGLLKYVEVNGLESPFTADLNLSGIYQDRYLLGASYRTDNTLILMAQVQITKNLNFGYAFDVKTSEYERNAGGFSHEFFLGFDLGTSSKKITNPRFVSYF